MWKECPPGEVDKGIKTIVRNYLKKCNKTQFYNLHPYLKYLIELIESRK